MPQKRTRQTGGRTDGHRPTAIGIADSVASR